MSSTSTALARYRAHGLSPAARDLAAKIAARHNMTVAARPEVRLRARGRELARAEVARLRGVEVPDRVPWRELTRDQREAAALALVAAGLSYGEAAAALRGQRWCGGVASATDRSGVVFGVMFRLISRLRRMGDATIDRAAVVGMWRRAS